MSHAVDQHVRPREGARELRRILLVEDQPDHAALLRETLAGALPGVGLCSVSDDASLPEISPDVLLLSLCTDPAVLLPDLRCLVSRGTVLIALSGVGERWREEDLAPLSPAARLDKRDGVAFLSRLPQVVVETWRAAIAGAPPSLPEVRAVPPQRVLPAAPRPVPADREQRCTEAVAGLLAGTLEHVIAGAGSLTGLVRSRYPRDEALGRYVGSLEHELARARALTRRLAAVAGPESAPSRRRMGAGHLITLRGPAWCLLAPPTLELEFAADERTPDVDLIPEVAGPTLDDLVQRLVSDAPEGSRLTVQLRTAMLDEDACCSRRGLKPGRYAQIAAMIAGSVGLEALDPRGRLLERALAGVKAHGGYLELSTDRTSGGLARFDVYLPAAPPARVRAGAVRPGTVLLVDDDDRVRSVALEMLRAAGLEPFEASSGEQAVELFRAGCRYDLVLLDLALGAGMNGQATFAKLRAIEPRTAVVLVSGSVSGETLRDLLEDGLLGFVPKPFGLRQLVGAVRAGLGIPA